MGGKPRKSYEYRHPALPSLFASMYPIMRDTALEHGYALALHGSLGRDFDVVAVPWVDDAADADTLVDAIVEVLDAWIITSKRVVMKPHGRRGYSIHLKHARTYVDLSVMPRV